MILPRTNPWGPRDCTRPDCVPCGQGDERRIDCKKRNILYENKCELCNPDQKDGRKVGLRGGGRGIYVGVGCPEKDQFVKIYFFHPSYLYYMVPGANRKKIILLAF